MNPTLKDLRAKKACKEGYKFYKESNCDPKELVQDHADWYLWLAVNCSGDWINADTLKQCALKCPWEALMHASASLDAETLKHCAIKYPEEALRYASALLDADTLRECRELSN